MTPLLSVQSIGKAFSARALFQNISFGINEGERIGVIGPNGSGKSTLIKILAGRETPDSGLVSARRRLRIGYVPQEDDFPPESTVAQILTDALAELPLDETERELQITLMLTSVGFPDRDQRASELSGGWRKRLAIAREIIRDPELLLLDEPTNHLDLEGILWLEELLGAAPFACLLVSHDRFFLERVATRLIELNRAYPEGYLSAEGAYSDFLEKKDAFLDAQQQRQHALAGQVKREVEWLRRGAPARTTKAKGRIESAGQLINELAEVKYRNAQNRSADIDFSATNRRTKELLVAKDLKKCAGSRLLFDDVNFTLSPGSRLGLLGPNGSGKTTLLKVLSDALPADGGTAQRADGLRVVLFDQNREQLDRKVPLRTALSPNSDNVTFNGGSMHVSAWARRFLFNNDQLDMPVGSLSGGEQARVLIARLMLRPADLLILDEPTNDLDIPTLEVLEQSLLEFPGALVLVTHDRYLLDRVSTNLLALDGKGGATFYADYSQWEAKQNEGTGNREQETENASAIQNPKPKVQNSAIRRLSTAEQRELQNMEATITGAEEQVAALQDKMSQPEIVADYQKLKAVMDSIHDAEKNVAALYARWEDLEARK